MKLSKDDPKLTAYAFGELSAKETRELARELERRPDLQAVVDELLAIEEIFQDEGNAKYALRPEQRAAIFQASNEPANVVAMPKQSWAKSVVAVLGVAAAVILTLTVIQRPAGGSDKAVADLSHVSDEELFQRIGRNHSEWSEGAGGEASDVSSRDAKHVASESVAWRSEMEKRARSSSAFLENLKAESPARNEWVAVGDEPLTRMPLVAGNASYGWIAQALEAGRWPSPSVVRTEELLNKLPASQSADLTVDGVSSSVEIVHSPWVQGEWLVLVDVVAREDRQVEAALAFSENVEAYQLIGYAQANQGSPAPAVQSMRKGVSHKLAYTVKFIQPPIVDDVCFDLKLRVHSGTSQKEQSLSVLYASRQCSELSSNRMLDVTVLSWSRLLKEPSDLTLRSVLDQQLARVASDDEEMAGMLKLMQLRPTH